MLLLRMLAEDRSNLQSAFFDVPLHYRLYEASKQGPDFDLRTIFQRTLVEKRPWDAVTFVDNHELSRYNECPDDTY